MKLNELAISQQSIDLTQLDEVNWKNAVATGALAAATALFPSKMEQPVNKSRSDSGLVQAADHLKKRPVATQSEALMQQILSKYKRVDPQLAKRIADLAIKYADPVFPTARDILAITGIESSFRPDAVSGLKRDPARGLMQVRPGVWGMSPSDLATVEQQLKHGSTILADYFRQLKNVDDAVHAYNVGITNFRKQKNLNPSYVAKYKNEKQLYTQQDNKHKGI